MYKTVLLLLLIQFLVRVTHGMGAPQQRETRTTVMASTAMALGMMMMMTSSFLCGSTWQSVWIGSMMAEEN